MTDNLFNTFVTTDQEDYTPGSTATFTAEGFGVGETVEFSVAHVDPGADGIVGTADDSLVHDLSGTTASWTVTDGGAGDLDGVANGVIVTSWGVNQDAANQAFVLSASNTAGLTATATFTDTPPGDGVLLAPTGQSPTGEEYNPVKWAVLDGDTITDTIVGADDAYVVNGTVQVQIQSSEHGNQVVTGTFDANGADNIVGTADDDSITFTWTVQDSNGGDICDTLVVSYQTGVTGGNQPSYSLVGGDKQGYGVVDAQGNHHDVCIEVPNWTLYKDVDVSVSGGFCDDPSIPQESNGVTENTVAVDADHEGQVLTYTVTLVNDGGVAIHGVTVTDNYEGGGDVDLGAPDSGDDANVGVLDPGETWVWSYTHEVTQGEIDSNGGGDGLLSNVVTATTTDDLDIPNPATQTTDVEVCWQPNWELFKDVDVSVSGGFCDDPSIPQESNGVTENTVAIDADHEGQVLTYTVTLVNDGNVAIHGVTVTDNYEGGGDVDLGAPDSGDDANVGVLDPGETWVWSYTHEVTQGEIDSNGGGDGLLSNVVTATTTDDLPIPNPATQTTDVEVCQVPSVTIDKYIVCPDDGETLTADDVNLLNVNGWVSYEIIVSNTGNVTLSPVVTDTNIDLSTATLVESGDADGILDPGETWTYTYSIVWEDGSHSNTAEVTDSAFALDETDSASYFGLNPHITVDKQTNGVDHGLQIAAGSAVTWTYDVTNDGNVDNLTGLVVTDDPSQVITPIESGGFNVGDTNQDGNLDVGETWQFEASGIAETGFHPDTVTATTDAISDDCGDSVTPTAQDDSDYTGTFEPGTPGLTAGFWSQHFRAWDTIDNPVVKGGYNLNNLVDSGVLEKTDVLADLHCVGKLLIGDSNGNNLGDGGEVILKIDSLDGVALKLVSASLSTKSDARLNTLQQAVASQLNIDNHEGASTDRGPGGDGADSLIGTAAKWLLGGLAFEAGGTNAAFTVDTNSSGTLDTGDFLNFAKLVFSGNAVSTSSADWNSNFLIDGDNAYLGHDKVVATGEDLKDALEAYNQGHLVTSADGSQIGWSEGGVVSDVFLNNQDGLWATLTANGIGAHHA